MPRFVANGPDLPVELLEAQTADKLVIFAGAGVSRPELPDFRGLVVKLYEELGEVREGAEKRLFQRGEYDQVLNSLEDRVAGLREKVRDLLRDIPKSFEPTTHRALLDIARAGGSLRLVTTNFDRLFLKADPDLDADATRSIGPRLPTPRPSHWKGLVHLHGLIPLHDSDCSNLVLTSSDFGRAYLVDQWASRFVTELFRHFHVLFVGYGVNDPVLRYLLSALAAEGTKDGGFKPAFALAGVQGSQRERKEREEDWEAKGVTPIFYHSGRGHRALSKTLEAWAKLSRGGLQARQSLALQNVDNPPSNPGDDQAHLTVWALSEASGSVAKAFAEREPPPPIEWLQIFEDPELQGDQKLLALPEQEESPPSPLVSWPSQAAFSLPLTEVTRELARWIVKHLDTREAVEWSLSKGAVLHPVFRRLVRSRLETDQSISRQRRMFWEVVASETYAHLKAHEAVADRYGHPYQPESSWLRYQEMVSLLRPVPRLVSNQSLRIAIELALEQTTDLPDFQDNHFRVDVELLGGSTAYGILDGIAGNPEALDWAMGMSLVRDAPQLLREALLWQNHFSEGEEQTRTGYIWMPSISPHPQNEYLAKWTRLIDLNRSAFEWLERSDPARVQSLVDNWLSFDFPLFLRLALHAVTESKSLDPDLGVELLLADSTSFLWEPVARRESLRFLRKAGNRPSVEAQARLIQAILQGPSVAEEIVETVGRNKVEDYRQEEIWRRLIRLKVSGVDLPAKAEEILALGKKKGWSIPEDRNDEFASWSYEPMPMEEEAETLRDRFRNRPKFAVCELGREARSGRWDSQKWRLALQEFGTPSYEDLSDRRRLAVVLRWLEQMPDDKVEFLLHQVSWWLQEQARRIPAACERSFLTVVGQVTDLALQQEVYEGNVIDRALNHPAGHLTQALLRRIWSRQPKADQGIPAPLEPLLRKLAEEPAEPSRMSRAMLARDLGTLFLLDTKWTKEVLLPHFCWESAPDAESMWQAFLSHPRWGPNLIARLKKDFLAAFGHLEDLEPYRENACRSLVFTSIHYPEALSKKELEKVLREMTPDDLASVAGALETVLSDSDQPGTVWRETVQPWIEDHWPRRQNAQSPEVSHALALVVLETGDAFPQAVDSMKSRLKPLEERNSQRVDWQMKEKGLARQFSEESLDLLDQLVPEEPTQSWSDLGEILDTVEEKRPDLTSDSRMRRLREVILRSLY